jgi:MFS family permease
MTESVGGQERALAEAWFAHHGLPWFVDDIRDEVAGRLTRMRVVGVGLLAAAIGVGTGLLVKASPAPSFAVVAGISAAALAIVAYALVALHATPIARWALRRALRSLGLLLPLATRALPILMLFITFLFINTEVWQVASALHGGELWAAVLCFAAVAAGFLVPRLAQELDRFDDQVQIDEVLAGTANSPLSDAAQRIAADDVDLPDQAQVTGLQMVNLVLVLVIAQAVQVFLLSVAVFAFFLLFGALAIDPSVITSWVGDGHPEYLPGPEIISIELLHVSLFLAGFSGLYFTVVAITDELYRREFFTVIMQELARAVSMRVIYRMLSDTSIDT